MADFGKTYWSKFNSVKFEQRISDNSANSLVLPRTFVENVRDKLFGKINLKTGNGKIWVIELGISDESGLSLKGEAWKQFFKTYCLKKNDNLSFEYCHNSNFVVTIFDSETGCEKISTYFPEIDVFSSRDYDVPNERGRKRLPQNLTAQKKKFLVVSSSDSDSDSDDDSESESETGNDVKIQRKGNVKVERVTTTNSSLPKQRDAKLEMIMQPSYVAPRCYLVVSAIWARRVGLDKKEKQNIMLRSSVGKTFEGVFTYRETCSAYINVGCWKQFVMEYNVEVDDICSFRIDPDSVDPVIIDVVVLPR